MSSFTSVPWNDPATRALGGYKRESAMMTSDTKLEFATNCLALFFGFCQSTTLGESALLWLKWLTDGKIKKT